MKIELTGYELKDAISQYLAKMFKQPIEEVTISDDQCVECYITLGSDKVDEDEPEVIETKVKRTRKKSEPKSEPEEVKEEVDEEKSTHYSNLPTLDSEEHSTYIELLKLLASNPRNKNRQYIQSLYDSASDNLRTVIEANSAYQDWIKLCEKEDNESPELKMLREVNEEVDEQESQETVTTVEPKVETTEQVNTTTPHKPLFAFNNSVNKSGSLFPSSK